jgi:hypothetical protein
MRPTASRTLSCCGEAGFELQQREDGRSATVRHTVFVFITAVPNMRPKHVPSQTCAHISLLIRALWPRLKNVSQICHKLHKLHE